MRLEDIELDNVTNMLDVKIEIMKSVYEENQKEDYGLKIENYITINNFIKLIIEDADIKYIPNTIKENIASIITTVLSDKPAHILNSRPSNEIYYVFYGLNQLKEILKES